MARGILFLSKTDIELYVPTLPQVVKIPFTSELVKDLEVVSDEKIQAALQGTFATNKIVPPNSFLVLLADSTLFMREFPKAVPAIPVQNPSASPTAPVAPAVPQMKAADLVHEGEFIKEQDLHIQSFIDKVPFENVSSKIITTETARKVIATNKDLYMVFKNALSKMGNTVEAVVPAIVLQKVVNVTSGITPDTARSVLMQSDLIKQNDLLSEGSAVKHTVVDSKTGKEKPTNTRAYILIGVFGLLFLFMIILYYMMYMRPKPVRKKAVKTPAVSTVKPTEAKEIDTKSPVSASASAATLSALTVRINAPTSSTQSGRLRTQLMQAGVKTISVIPSTTQATRTLVIFSSDIPDAARTTIMFQVTEVIPTATSQESNQGNSTVVITLGSR